MGMEMRGRKRINAVFCLDLSSHHHVWETKGGLSPGFGDSGPGLRDSILICASTKDEHTKMQPFHVRQLMAFPGKSTADCSWSGVILPEFNSDLI